MASSGSAAGLASSSNQKVVSYVRRIPFVPSAFTLRWSRRNSGEGSAVSSTWTSRSGRGREVGGHGSEQGQDGGGEHLGRLLRQVVPGAGHEPMFAEPGDVGSGARRTGAHAVIGSVEDDRRHGVGGRAASLRSTSPPAPGHRGQPKRCR